MAPLLLPEARGGCGTQLVPTVQPAFLYASCEWRHLFVKLSLTLAPAFLLLKDLQRNRLAGRLTKAPVYSALEKCEEKYRTDAIAAACAAAFPGCSQALIREAATYLTDFCASQ